MRTPYDIYEQHAVDLKVLTFLWRSRGKEIDWEVRSDMLNAEC
jgi:hypothetical protein